MHSNTQSLSNTYDCHFVLFVYGTMRPNYPLWKAILPVVPFRVLQTFRKCPLNPRAGILAYTAAMSSSNTLWYDIPGTWFYSLISNILLVLPSQSYNITILDTASVLFFFFLVKNRSW